MSLMHSLSMAARSLQAQQYAMDITGQNIANVNTPGYTRRVVDFAAVPPDAGGGVEIERVRAVRDALLDRQVLNQVPLESRDAAMAEVLAMVETAFSVPGQGLDAQLDAFFSAFAELADAPTSTVARRGVQSAAAGLASAFAETAGQLESARQDADTRIRDVAARITELAERVAAINTALPAARQNGTAQTLEDQQWALVRELSQLAGVHVIARAEGGVDLTIGAGRPLVVGESAFALEATPTPPGGYAVLSSEGVTLTNELTAGTLGGLLHVRDTILPGYQASLDTIAFETAAQVNTAHAAGYDLAGNAGGAFFSFSTPPVGTTGAASAIQLDPAVAADPALIAAAAVPEVGDNGAARAIAALRDARVLDGQTTTLVDGWAGLVYRVGADARHAADARDTRAEVVRQVDAMRDQVSAVSLDEEALNLLKFQRAYEANARFFRAVDDMLVTLLNLV